MRTIPFPECIIVDNAQIDLIISRIVSGRIILRINNTKFLLAPPSPIEKYFSEEVYTETFKDAKEQGLFSEEDEIIKFLISHGIWNQLQNKALSGLPKDINKFKEALYENRLQSDKVAGIRKHLKNARVQLDVLYTKRHSHDHLTCESQAIIAKGKYIIGCGLRTELDQKVFRYDGFWKDSSGLLDRAVEAYSLARLGETQIRQVSRSDQWKSIWSMKKSGSPLFMGCASDFTEEQKSLIGWSILYDSIREHPECPADEYLNDDDMLDGWMSLQRKKNEVSSNKRDIEGLITNNKIKNSQEVFIKAGTVQDAQKIDSLNDDISKRIKKTRQNLLNQKGQVNEIEMPDVKQDLMMEIAKKAKS